MPVGFWRRIERAGLLLPCLFLLFALPMAGFLAVVIPPLQNPDEYAHYVRAEQLSRGHWFIGNISEVIERGTGGDTHASLPRLEALFANLRFHPEAKVAPAQTEAAHQLGWDAEMVRLPFMVSYIYAPFFYGPSATGILVGKLAGLDLVRTLILARLFNAVCCIALAAAALAITRRGGCLLYTILLFPMTLSLMAACSQDGLILSVSAFVVALVSRCVGGREAGVPAASRRLGLLAPWLLLLIVSRAPYILLAPLTLLCGGRKGARWWTLGGLIAVGVAWHLMFSYALSRAYVHLGIAISDQQSRHYLNKLAFLAADPLEPFRLIATTLAVNGAFYGRSAIGILGWLDLVLPGWFYSAVTLVVVVALALAALDPRSAAGGSAEPAQRSFGATAVPVSVFLATVPGCFLAILFSLYLVENAVGDMVVKGVQGRYLLPLAMVAGLFVPRLPAVAARLHGWATPFAGLVLAAPLLTLVVVSQQVLLRYYPG